MNFEPIIGLEVHVELKTKSKMFCGCPADYFGHEPNTHTCPVCLGLPGALPVPNKKAVEWCLLLGLALNCKVNEDSYFERKNYFYPDLPKGYQISQYARPFCVNGRVEIKSTSGVKIIRINRVHMEEDTGKLTHGEVNGEKVSLVDFNRSGVPLVEIVTEPDFRSTEEVVEYLKKLQLIIRYLGISDADMEEGSMRLEPTINLKATDGVQSFYTPLVEIKNINSFRFVKQALEYEIKRQAGEFERTREEKKPGNKTTAGYSEAKRVTVPQRSKEEANDYRYFPEPDIPPIHFTQDQISNIKNQIGELPDEKVKRYVKDWSIKESDAQILVSDLTINGLFEKAAKIFEESKYPVSKLASLIVNRKISIVSDTSPEDVVKDATAQMQKPVFDEHQITEICVKIISENKEAVEQYKAGKEQGLKYLAGLVMRETKGVANPKDIPSILESFIRSRP